MFSDQKSASEKKATWKSAQQGQIRSNVKHFFTLNGLGCFLPNAAYSMLIMETIPN